MANKYATVSISGIIMNISKNTETKGYTESIVFCNLPEIDLTKDQERNWIKENNYRMEAICKFMNENNL